MLKATLLKSTVFILPPSFLTFLGILNSNQFFLVSEQNIQLCTTKPLFLRMDIRKNFFSVRLVRCWNGLPKEILDGQSVEAFKVRLDVALGSLI